MITLIIPAYNEEHRISKTLRAYAEYFQRGVKMLVVLNGCTDHTIDVVRSYTQEFPGRIYFEEIKNPGKGYALQDGFSKAKGEIVGFVDADGATTPEEFDKLIKNLGRHDGIIASRWHEQSKVENRTWQRAAVSKGFVWVEKLLFRLPYTDTQCGAKLFRRDAISKIVPHMKVGNMAVDVELLWLMKKGGFSILEYPTHWRDQSKSAELGSPFKLISGSFRVFLTLCKLRIRFFFLHSL